MAATDQVWCRDCGAGLVFVLNRVTGKGIPCDRLPDTGRGNVCAIKSGVRWTGFVISAERPRQEGPGWRLFVPHFASCPARNARRAPETKPEPLF